METTIAVTAKEQQRAWVLTKILQGELSMAEGAGIVVVALFREQEDGAGHLGLLPDVVTTKRIPDAIYRDRHGAFAPTNGRRGGEDGSVGPASLSQVGRALVELGIGSIAARSPQAKGRIERLWGTFQDRLVVELRLAGVTDLAGANAFLPSFLARHNARFAVPAADPLPAWRHVPATVNLERVFVFKYTRKVAKDHTIHLAGQVLQLPRGTGRSNDAGKRVEVHVRLDGSIVAFDGERELAATPAPLDPAQLRALDVGRAGPSLVPPPATIPWSPPADHPGDAGETASSTSGRQNHSAAELTASFRSDGIRSTWPWGSGHRSRRRNSAAIQRLFQ